jgi:hypothetical protein
MSCAACSQIRSDLKSAVTSGNVPDAAKAVSEGAKLAAQQAISVLKRKAPALLRRPR